MSVPVALNRLEVSEAYAALSPVIFGIIARIAQDETIAQAAFIDVFLCLHKRGLIRQNQSWQSTVLLPLVFDCIAKALSAQLPKGEIQSWIEAERSRMQEYLQKQCG